MIYSRTLHAQPYFTFQRSSAALFRRLVHSHLIKAGFPTGYSVIFNNFERVVSLINFSRYRVSRCARESMKNESWISRVWRTQRLPSRTRQGPKLRSFFLFVRVNFDRISPSSTDLRWFDTVQRIACKVRELKNVTRISAWQFGLVLFSKCAASTPSPIFFVLFPFLSFFFLFSTSIGRRLRPTGDTASPRLCLFHPVLDGAPPVAAARLFASMAGRAGVRQRARDKCHATRSLRYSAGRPSITDVSSISFSSCLCALLVSAQPTRLAESLRLLRLRRQQESRVAPPPHRTLRTDSFKI